MHRHPIRFGLANGQQHVQWSEMRQLWELADRLNYDSLWTCDHFYPIMVADPSGPCLEGWTTLAALTEHTRRARIGVLVSGNTYRNPCLTAKMAATVDQISGGRFNLGIGAGWFELEHRSFGFDFMTTRARLEALDEACQIIKGMLTQEKTTFHGKHYDVIDAMCNPKALQQTRPPIMIGGQGEKILLRIVAQHADMWNTVGTADRMRHLIEVIRRHGDSVGRDTDEIEKTVAIGLCYGASKEREQLVLRMAAALARSTPEEAREQVLIGSKQECLDTIERYLRAGVSHFLLINSAPFPLEEIQRFAEDVIPATR